MLAENGSGCVMTPVENEMPPSFAVVVRDLGIPVAGLRVRVETNNPDEEDVTVLEGLTDGRGTLHVKHLSPGLYWVIVGEHTGFIQWHLVRVKEQSVYRLSNLLESNWVPAQVLRLRSFGGILTDLDLAAEQDEPQKPRRALGNVFLAVKEARSLRTVAEASTADDGSFHFPALPPGLYVVKVRLPKDVDPDMDWTIEGELPLEVSSGETVVSEPVELAVAFTSCGLMYKASVVN
jgi:hypothetical protein